MTFSIEPERTHPSVAYTATPEASRLLRIAREPTSHMRAAIVARN
tara:strand:+ start:153 stop:287 length:135 start_codon:yes stop_codon:yes gene_type:complete